MNIYKHYQPIFDDQPEKIASSVYEKDTLGLSFFDVALFLDKKKCLQSFKYQPRVPPYEGEDFVYREDLLFENVQIFKKVLYRCKKAKDNNWIDQKKLFRGFYLEKQIVKKSNPKFLIEWINSEIGYGVFADQEIKKNSFVGEYVGIVKKRPFFCKKNVFIMRYPTLFKRERDYVIDAEHKGNFTRFINHSTDPNLELESVFISPFTRMVFTAKRKIEKEEQLTFDYGKLFWKKRGYKEL